MPYPFAPQATNPLNNPFSAVRTETTDAERVSTEPCASPVQPSKGTPRPGFVVAPSALAHVWFVRSQDSQAWKSGQFLSPRALFTP